MVCEIKQVDRGLLADVWEKITQNPDGSAIHVTVEKGRTRVRWIKYIRRDKPHKPEILIAVIDGHSFVWVWGPECWDETIVRIWNQARAGDTPLEEQDAVALVKLRLESVE